jgi:hypothetical protein
MVNWDQVGAVTGIIAVLETPLLKSVRGARKWVKSVDERLERLEGAAGIGKPSRG